VAHPEWSLRGQQCLLEAEGKLWIGDLQAPWDPWSVALGHDHVAIARSVVEAIHDFPPAVAPPAAVSVTSPTFVRPSRELLRAIDHEIQRAGLDRWSDVVPGIYIGGPFEAPGALDDHLGNSGSVHIGNEWWFLRGESRTARHVWTFKTPRGRLLWAPDDTLSAWEDCSELVVPPIFPGPMEPGYETGFDPEGELMTVIVHGRDGENGTKIVVAMSDEACRRHPVVGPMIEHLLSS
jgi:hypothetical protein